MHKLSAFDHDIFILHRTNHHTRSSEKQKSFLSYQTQPVSCWLVCSPGGVGTHKQVPKRASSPAHMLSTANVSGCGPHQLQHSDSQRNGHHLNTILNPDICIHVISDDRLRSLRSRAPDCFYHKGPKREMTTNPGSAYFWWWLHGRACTQCNMCISHLLKCHMHTHPCQIIQPTLNLYLRFRKKSIRAQTSAHHAVNRKWHGWAAQLNAMRRAHWSWDSLSCGSDTQDLI